MRVEVSAATRHTVEDLGFRVVSQEWTGIKGRLKVSHSLRGVFARSRREAAPKVGSFRKNAFVVLFALGYARSGRVRAGSGRRVGPPARPRTTRTVARRVVPPRTRSRCASVASRDAPRDVRRIPRLRSRSPKSRLGAVASERERSPETREEDALRTWTWKTASCGWTCGFGRGGDDGTRSAPGREARATRRRATDAGMSASCDDGGWETRSARVPDRRPRVARDASRSTNALGGHGHLAGHEGGGHGHGGHVCLGVWEGSGEVRALECIAHASAQPFYR